MGNRSREGRVKEKILEKLERIQENKVGLGLLTLINHFPSARHYFKCFVGTEFISSSLENRCVLNPHLYLRKPKQRGVV